VNTGRPRFVLQNASWEWRTFNLTSDLELADNGVGQVINSINPDLRPFRDRGGKMIHYHGWADSAIAPTNSINYYNEVKDVVSDNNRPYCTRSNHRDPLFEQRRRERYPIPASACPFPHVPRLIATGDPADASRFKCARDLPQWPEGAWCRARIR